MKEIRQLTADTGLSAHRQRKCTIRQGKYMVQSISAKVQVLTALAIFAALFIFRAQPACAADYGTYDHSQDAAITAKLADLNNISGTTFVLDLTENHVPVKQVYAVMQHLVNENPEIFYLQFTSGNCKVEKTKQYAAKITVQLDDNRQGIEKKMADFNAAVKNIVESADFDQMNTVETVVYLHNYLVENVEYCGEMADYKTAYSALIDGCAGSSGYVLAFNYLLKQFDIPCGYAVSKTAVHTWNVVNVHNKWYHIDVTWNDIGSTQKQSYQYLFLDENTLLSVEPDRKDMDIQIEDYRYADSGRLGSMPLGREFWNLTDTDVVYVNGCWYYTATERKNIHTIKRYNADTEKTDTIAEDTGVWYIWGSKSDCGENYTHLTTDGNDLYYSTATAVYRYSPSDGKTSVYALPSTNSGYIYDLKAKDNAVWYATGRSGSDVGGLRKATQVYIDPSETSLKKVTAGAGNFTASWKKQTTRTTGYELQYSAKKNFKRAKAVDVANSKTVKTTVEDLTAGKTYYVRIRTYNTVKGNKYFSDWSAAKRVVTD